MFVKCCRVETFNLPLLGAGGRALRHAMHTGSLQEGGWDASQVAVACSQVQASLVMPFRATNPQFHPDSRTKRLWAWPPGLLC